ncbi:MAG TPA: hypothetical protein VMH86_04645 [Rhizomicrobium sp.]|nr:hypothetical protein [Rhizomicrobium sp.]
MLRPLLLAAVLAAAGTAAAASLIRLRKENHVPDRDLIVLFSADEEVGLEQDGPNFMVTEKRPLVDAGLVMNPDGGSGEIKNGKRLDFAIETVQKTYMTFTMETANRGGHSSEPRPDNAIYQLANGLVRLSKYQFPYNTNATTRAHGRDERHEIGNFCQTVEFTYRLMKELGQAR